MAGKVSITSEQGPQKHQDHRSSDNFSTAGLTGTKIRWSCPEGTSFYVWHDVSGGSDKKMFYNMRITNGTITSMLNDSRLYIADPNGATGRFTVTAEGIEENSTITSEPNHMSGQDNRSSDNFGTMHLNGTSMRWRCPDGISFHVWQDISAGTDGKLFYDKAITNGTITEMVNKNGLYIANPSGATKSFNVSFEGVNNIITSQGSPMSGQSHRSSSNFSTKALNGTRIKWSCPNNVSFNVWKDISGGTDEKMFYNQRITNGTITEMVSESGLYISDPKGASGSFDVLFEGCNDNAITSEARPIDGQEERSSCNFTLNMDYAKVICGTGISFKMKEDVSAGTDNDIVYDRLSHGMGICLKDFKNKGIYISDPQGATTPFTVIFEPVIINAVDTANWMSKLPNKNLKLSQLSIPGSHDSGTKVFTNAIPSMTGGRCQNSVIAEQLTDGIRFLDIRLNNSTVLLTTLLSPSEAEKLSYPGVTAMGKNESLIISHGELCSCGISFGQVLEVCAAFLKAHPGEVILMSVKNDGKNEISSEFEEYLKCYKDIFYFTETIPTLEQAKGKIVLFYRFEFTPSQNAAAFSGTGIRLEINNNTYTYYENAKKVFFYVEDHYKAHDTRDKRRFIENALNQAIYPAAPPASAKTNGSDKVPSSNYDINYLTFCNIATTVIHTPFDYAWGLPGGVIKDIDPAINRWLKEYLITGYGPRRLGVVIMDFYDHEGDYGELCQLIIGQQKQ